MRKSGLACLVAVVLVAAVACTKKTAVQQLGVEIPAGCNRKFVPDMGVRGADPFPGKAAPTFSTFHMNGKVQTSTLLESPQVTFKNSSDGNVWGYSQRALTTGDGIPAGGTTEFFVGTQKQLTQNRTRSTSQEILSARSGNRAVHNALIK